MRKVQPLFRPAPANDAHAAPVMQPFVVRIQDGEGCVELYVLASSSCDALTRVMDNMIRRNGDVMPPGGLSMSAMAMDGVAARALRELCDGGDQWQSKSFGPPRG